MDEEEVLPRMVPGLGRTEATLGCLFVIGVPVMLLYPTIGLPLLVGVGLWGVVSRFTSPERRIYATYLQARAAFRKGNYRSAAEALEWLRGKEWGREPIRRGLAHCYYHLERWREARVEFAALLAPSETDQRLAADADRRLELTGVTATRD